MILIINTSRSSETLHTGGTEFFTFLARVVAACKAEIVLKIFSREAARSQPTKQESLRGIQGWIQTFLYVSWGLSIGKPMGEI